MRNRVPAWRTIIPRAWRGGAARASARPQPAAVTSTRTDHRRSILRAARILALTGSLGLSAPTFAGCQVPGPTELGLAQDRIGNVFLTDEVVRIPVTTSAPTLAWTIHDFSGTQVGAGQAKVGRDHHVTMEPATGRPGYFELHLTAVRDGKVVAQRDTTFAVVAPPARHAGEQATFGVMTHFSQGWDLDVLPLISRAGLQTFRDEQPWQDVEPARGTYRFGAGDQAYLAAAQRAGLEPLIELTFGNRLYDHDPVAPAVAWTPCTPDGYAGYAHYARAVLAQYGSQIRTLEVWNEYNGGFCVGPATADRPKFYTEMLRAAYGAIKAARPDVRVLGGASVLAPQPWFEQLFAAGALDYMDAAAVHPYFAVPEDVEPNIAAIQQSMARYNHGQGPKPIWATETSLADPVHPGRQDMARNLVRSLTVMRAAGVERIYWYLLRDYNEFNTGLVRSDRDPLGRYAPTSAYPAYANLVQQLSGANFLRRETTDLRTRVYLFDRAGEEVRCAWTTAGEPATLLLHASGPIEQIDLMGVAQRLEPRDGVITLRLDPGPVYLRGHIEALEETGRDLLLADSVTGFSGVQGSDPGTWSYGYYRAGAGAAYEPASVRLMTWTHTDWDFRWQSPYAYAAVTNTIQHPSFDGPTPVWTVRRWLSSTAGNAHIRGTASHVSDGGDGAGCKIFVDGKAIFERLLGGSSGTNTTSFDVAVQVRAGSRIDFVVTPGPGTDINFDTIDLRAEISLPKRADAAP